MLTVAATVACGGGGAGELLTAEEGAERRAGGAAGLRGVRRRHDEVRGGLWSGVAARGGDVAAAPANGAGEEGQLRRAAAGATELETRKKKYGVERENETDLVVGSDKFFMRRGGRRKMEKLAAFSLSPLPLFF